MASLKKYKNILIGIVVVIVLFLLYSFFFKGSSSEQLLTSETATSTAGGEDLLSLLLELKSITLTTEIFSDPVFTTLQDFSVELAPQPIGRRNPFAPIGVATGPQELPTGKTNSASTSLNQQTATGTSQ